MSSGVTPTYFQKYCNHRKFLVYVYALAQSTGPRLDHLILWTALFSSNMFCRMLAAYPPVYGIGRVPSAFE